MPKTATSDVASAVAGHAVRQARKDAGTTQQELATRLGVNASYISNLEAGRVNPTIGQMAAIADALGYGLTLTLTRL